MTSGHHLLEPSRRRLLASTALVVTTGVAGCTDERSSPTPTRTSAGTPTAGGDGSPGLAEPALSSPVFGDGEPIPTAHTCSGENRSPPLSIGEVPADAETLALVMDDPDAGSRPYVHWLVWDVPAGRTEWPAGVPDGETADALDGAAQGTNSRGTVGYVGPCPPPGDGPHTYRFALYVLGTSLDLDPGAERSAVEAAIEDVEYGVATLRGTFER